MKRLMKSVALVAVLLLAGTTVAEDRRPVVGTRIPTDQEFVANALAANTKEIQLGNKAKDKATSEQVRKFAQEMVADHTKAREELMNIVKDQRIAVVTGETPEFRQLLLQLTRADGGEFDQLYMTHMVDSHQKALNMFESYARNGKNAQLKAYAEKTLPSLREHLKQARDIAGNLKK